MSVSAARPSPRSAQVAPPSVVSQALILTRRAAARPVAGLSTKAKRTARRLSIATTHGAKASRRVVPASQTVTRVHVEAVAARCHTQSVPPSVGVEPEQPAAIKAPPGSPATCDVWTGSVAAQLSASRPDTDAGPSHP